RDAASQDGDRSHLRRAARGVGHRRRAAPHSPDQLGARRLAGAARRAPAGRRRAGGGGAARVHARGPRGGDPHAARAAVPDHRGARRQAKEGLGPLAIFTAFISVNLAVLNLLPVPMLDGGHLFFFVIEAILGRPLSLKKREAAQQLGFVLLMLLMVYALYNDLVRIDAFKFFR